MNRNTLVIRMVCVAISVCVVAVGQVQADPLVIGVETDKGAYVPGELLTVNVTAYNPNSVDSYLTFPSSLQAQYTMDGGYTHPTIGFLMLTDRTIPANSSYTWSFDHLWSEYSLSLGTHSLIGSVVNVGSSQPYSFDVISPTLPNSDVLINFEQLPDGRDLPTMGSFADQYAAWGVHFGQMRGGVKEEIAIYTDGNNQFASTGRATYPPGFNIIAEFDMPVYGISADVFSAAGRTITMIAKDANGQVIDSIVSATVPTVGQFVGPIALQCQTPIASAEWWPSSQNATLGIDNVYLTIPEPASGLLLMLGLPCLLRRERRKECSI